ncbi:hypothetical protein ACPRNU_25380, partial [Chromobacterium vaccinii]|uniref:hypothetical protein n=1 Tax=Chromobacterium vaccinii TaxID=1108595 RepID=UPI003C756BCC
MTINNSIMSRSHGSSSLVGEAGAVNSIKSISGNEGSSSISDIKAADLLQLHKLLIEREQGQNDRELEQLLPKLATNNALCCHFRENGLGGILKSSERGGVSIYEVQQLTPIVKDLIKARLSEDVSNLFQNNYAGMYDEFMEKGYSDAYKTLQTPALRSLDDLFKGTGDLKNTQIKQAVQTLLELSGMLKEFDEPMPSLLSENLQIKRKLVDGGQRTALNQIINILMAAGTALQMADNSLAQIKEKKALDNKSPSKDSHNVAEKLAEAKRKIKAVGEQLNNSHNLMKALQI